MIVFFSEPRLLYLPYKNADNMQREQTFIPGKNIIAADIWQLIVEQYKDDFENYYSKKFKVLKPIKQITDTEMSIGEDKIDIYALTVNDIYALIENTMDIDELKSYKDAENKGKDRKSVYKAVDKQIKKISTFESKMQNKSKG